MPVVLPIRKKRIDIVVPSQAIRDAKEKLGPVYFDSSLLERSHNAVELTKLVAKWDDLEKKKMKCARDISREQDRLMRNLNTYIIGASSSNTEALSSVEGVEAIDGKMITPGFRFKSNGDIKPSKISLLSVKLDDEDEELESFSNEHITDRKHSFHRVHATNSRSDGTSTVRFEPVNYEKEIHELENVIYDIYSDLARSQISLSNMASYRPSKVKTYLRAHTNEYLPTSELLPVQNYKHPNDRFAFKPGSSAKSEGNLHKKNINCPSHRSCLGCQFRLMAKNDGSLRLKDNLRSCRDYCKTRWNIAPRGKYVHSANALASSTSLAQKSSTFLDAKGSSSGISTINPVRKPSRFRSRVKFQDCEDIGDNKRQIPMKKAASMKDTSNRAYELDKTSYSSPAIDLKTRKSASALSGRQSDNRRCVSSTLSTVSGVSSAQSTARYLIDQESRIDMLKSMQAGEAESCQMKVDTFLRKLDTDNTLLHM